MNCKPIALAPVAGLLGAGASSLAPTPGRAQTGRVDPTLTINPAANVMLTCGWHTQCTPPYAYGPALDWDNSADGPVTWRSYTWRSDNCTCYIGYTNLYEVDTPDCYQIEQIIYDWYGVYRGTEYFEHTTTSWNAYTNYLTGGAQYWYSDVFQIGNAAWPEKVPDSCPATGPHTHQYGAGLEQSGTYPSSTTDNSPPYSSYPVTTDGWWQNDTSWCFYC